MHQPMLIDEAPAPNGERMVGQRIKQRRRELRLTQAQLAAKLKLSQPTLSAYESGQQHIPPYHLERIADALGVEQRYLRADTAAGRAALPDLVMNLQGEGLTINLSIRVAGDIDDARMAQVIKHLRRLLNETQPPPAT